MKNSKVVAKTQIRISKSKTRREESRYPTRYNSATPSTSSSSYSRSIKLANWLNPIWLIFIFLSPTSMLTN